MKRNKERSCFKQLSFPVALLRRGKLPQNFDYGVFPRLVLASNHSRILLFSLFLRSAWERGPERSASRAPRTT